MTIFYLVLAILSASVSAAAIGSSDSTARGEHAFVATFFGGLALLFLWLAVR